MADNILVNRRDYNDAKNKINSFNKEKRRVDSEAGAAKDSLASVKHELEEQINTTSNLESVIQSEQERLLNGLDNVRAGIQRQLEQENIHLREQLVGIRLDLGRTNVRVNEVNQRVADTAAQFDRNIQAIASRIANDKERAVFYRNQLSVLLDRIMTLNPDKLTPGEADEISQRLTVVNNDIEEGLYEAALGIAQLQMPVASELIVLLEVLNAQFSQIILDIDDVANAASERIARIREPQNNEQEIKVDDDTYVFDGRISFWSEGVLDDVIDRFDSVILSVREDYQPSMNLEALRTALNELRETDARLNDCTELAQNEFSEHCRLQSLVSRIFQTITRDNSWIIIRDESQYLDNDERRSYLLAFDNQDGIIASFAVTPARGRSGEIRFVLYVKTKDGSVATELCAAIRAGVLAQLRDAGINTDDIKEEDRARADNKEETNSEAVIQSTIAQANSKKDERISSVRSSVGL